MTIDEECSKAIEFLLARAVEHSASGKSGPCIVGLAGAAGSGKTTLAERLRSAMNERRPDLAVVVVPMDGYHLTRKELDALPDPKLAHEKRGAPWTFNPQQLAKDLSTLKVTGQASFPGFDHAAKDPQPDQYVVTPANKLVLVEGLYMAYAGWPEVTSLCDGIIFLKCDLAVTTERLTKRHMEAWSISREEAYARASGSDYDNSSLVSRELADNVGLILSSE